MALVIMEPQMLKMKFDTLQNDWREIRKLEQSERDQIVASFNHHLPQISANLQSIRVGSPTVPPRDISLAKYMEEEYGILAGDSDLPNNFLRVLGLSATHTTIDHLMTMPNMQGFKWLVPEIIREAIRQGIRRGTIHPDLIASDEVVGQDQVITPYISMSDATPRVIGETETIPVGTMKFGEKTTTLQKIGKGLEISYEVLRKVKLPLLSLYLQDVGVKLGLGLDALAIEVLINGDQADLSESAPVVGVTTINDITYKDVLRIWLRMGRLGRLPSFMIAGENVAIDLITLDEFKLKEKESQAGSQQLMMRTKLPTKNDIFVHGSVPADSVIFVDNKAALVKLTSQPLLVETDKIIMKQLQTTAVTTTVGFAKMFRDGAVVLTSTDTDEVGHKPFPSYMNADLAEQVSFNP